jgi:sugar-specific transcriptional regulator TrmB
MEEVLEKAGLTPKEAHIYRLLLERGKATAAQLADISGEKRTNVYALLDSLVVQELVSIDDSQAVRQFMLNDPMNLQKLIQAQQTILGQATIGLQNVMPQLRSQYSLVNAKPGVVHMPGEQGLLRLLDDMVRSSSEVLLVASDMADVEKIGGFKDKLLQRKANGVHTRAIAHDHDRERRRDMYAERGMELRFLGELPYNGEVVIYENNVVFTVYEPSIITTVVTNEHIAQTMRTMFEGLWRQAE